MLVTINVTQEIIDKAERNSCADCMLGTALNGVLAEGYIAYVRTRNDHFNGVEYTYHPNQFAFYSPNRRASWVDMPERAAHMADVFESEVKTLDGLVIPYMKHRDVVVEPFSFEVDLPEEAIKDEFKVRELACV